MKIRKACIISMTTLTLVVLVCGFISTPVSAATVYYPNQMSAFYSTSPSGSGGGATDVNVAAVAYPSSGYVYSHTGSRSDLNGAYQVDSKAGFRGLTFTTYYTGDLYVQYLWKSSWKASLGSSYLLSANAEGYLKFAGNLYCVNTQTWTQNGDVQVTAWDKKVSGGSVWYGEENDEYYWVTFTARVVSGQTYELYTYMSTHVKASSLAGLATAANNVGSDGKYAELVHVWVE